METLTANDRASGPARHGPSRADAADDDEQVRSSALAAVTDAAGSRPQLEIVPAHQPIAAAAAPVEGAMSVWRAQAVIDAAGRLHRCGVCSVPLDWLTEQGLQAHRRLHLAHRVLAKAHDARWRRGGGATPWR